MAAQARSINRKNRKNSKGAGVEISIQAQWAGYDQGQHVRHRRPTLAKPSDERKRPATQCVGRRQSTDMSPLDFSAFPIAWLAIMGSDSEQGCRACVTLTPCARLVSCEARIRPNQLITASLENKSCKY